MDLPNFSLNLSPESITSLIFLLITAFVSIVSIIMFFHWNRYGMGGRVMALTEILYLGVVVLLLSVSFFSMN